MNINFLIGIPFPNTIITSGQLATGIDFYDKVTLKLAAKWIQVSLGLNVGLHSSLSKLQVISVGAYSSPLRRSQHTRTIRQIHRPYIQRLTTVQKYIMQHHLYRLNNNNKSIYAHVVCQVMECDAIVKMTYLEPVHEIRFHRNPFRLQHDFQPLILSCNNAKLQNMRNIWRTIRWRNNARLPGAIKVLTNQHIGDSYCANSKLDTVYLMKTINTYLPRAHNFWKEIFFLMKWPVSKSPKQETKAKQIFHVNVLYLCNPYRFHQIHGLLENTITKYSAVYIT